MEFTSLKEFEEIESSKRFMRGLPIIVRIDGKKFSKWTADLGKPFDTGFSRCMIETSKSLCNETLPRIMYSQSDEISLIFLGKTPESQVFCDGRVHKMVSILASMATAYFNSFVPIHLEDKIGQMAFFDARAWSVPSKMAAIAYLIDRQHDCRKNSISMAASTIASHKELHGKNSDEKQEMLFAKGINWNDYLAHNKRGTFVYREAYSCDPGSKEHDAIPEKFRTNEPIIRSRLVESDIELSKVEDKEKFVFGRT